MTGLPRLSPNPIDDPVRRCQFFPAAATAAPRDMELAGRTGPRPDNRVASLTDEADRNE
jgi:hypothetical protein